MIGLGGPPFPMSQWPVPLSLGLRPGKGDNTLGGMVYDEDFNPTGHKMRGNSEAIVMAQIDHRNNLRIYYGSTGECIGMGV